MFSTHNLKILGIETSCDDTAAAVVQGKHVLASVVSSQDAVHSPYGGIVPELASRHHMGNIVPIVDAALEQAQVPLTKLDGMSVTCGPGLIGSLLVGVSFAKALAFAHSIPFVGVNHLEGHLLAVLLEQDVAFPFVCLLVSGGHTCLYHARDRGDYQRLGGTRDDAAGEAFDKAAKMMGFGYPGGRIIDQLAQSGDPTAFRFPRARLKKGKHDFSFSGLKTAMRQFLQSPQSETLRAADIAASYQAAVVDMLITPTLDAARGLGLSRVVVSGGVSANTCLRQRMVEEGKQCGIDVFVPSLSLCTDNAAMIAFAGAWHLSHGQRASLQLNASASLRL